MSEIQIMLFSSVCEDCECRINTTSSQPRLFLCEYKEPPRLLWKSYSTPTATAKMRSY